MKTQYQTPRVVVREIDYTDDLARFSVQTPDGTSFFITSDGDDPENGLAKGFSIWDEEEEEE